MFRRCPGPRRRVIRRRALRTSVSSSSARPVTACRLSRTGSSIPTGWIRSVILPPAAVRTVHAPGTYGNNMITLYNSELNALECIELGEPGWDPVNGVFRPHCDPVTGRATSVDTGRVNRVLMGFGTQRRTREIGAVDHSPGAPNSALTLGRMSGHARGDGQRGAGPLGRPGRVPLVRASCVDDGLPVLRGADRHDSRQSGVCVPAGEMGPDPWSVRGVSACFSRRSCRVPRTRVAMLAALSTMRCAPRRRPFSSRAVTLFREGYGWMVIGDYRASVEGPFLAALRGASGGPPSGYAGPNPGRELIAWRDLTAAGAGAPPLTMLNNGHCETAMDNEVLSPTWATAGRAGSIPLEGGPTWYGSDPVCRLWRVGFSAHRSPRRPLRSRRPHGR